MVTLSRVRRIKEDQQHTMGLDSAEILALVGSGVSVLETLDSLPTTSLTAGDEAFVKNNNKLYISKSETPHISGALDHIYFSHRSSWFPIL